MKTKLLIFGITGDLSRRKLLPALRRIVTTGGFNELEIIGVSRHAVDVAELLRNSVGDEELADRISIFTMDLTQVAEYEDLKAHLALQSDEQLLVYLSVPPAAATRIVDFIGEVGLNTPNVKVLFEKPFGMDLLSAKEMIARTATYFDEDQLYRIDHYLAKEMAQNIVAFRWRNTLFNHLWNHDYIESIEVSALESIGIEGRTQFYEQTGALKDVVQGHLMQLLALILIDIPDGLKWEELPALRAAALSQVLPADPAKATRAQYEGYKAEVGNANSQIETFASVQLASNDPKWRGVPIRLTTGKALAEKTTAIHVYLKKSYDDKGNCIIFRIQPKEGVDIDVFVKKPGYDQDFESRLFSFDYFENMTIPDAYEQVIADAIRSKKSLFTSSDEVLASWQILEPVQAAWQADNSPMPTYPVGSGVTAIIPSD